jgi:hypothetical protein
MQYVDWSKADTEDPPHTFRLLGFGVVLWAVVLGVAMAMGSWRTTNRPLFESMIAVTLATATVVMMTVHLRRVSWGFLRAGALAGVIWPAVSVALDMVVFSTGPMKMAFSDYVQDIALTYLMIPVIAMGMAYQRGVTFDRARG